MKEVNLQKWSIMVHYLSLSLLILAVHSATYLAVVSPSTPASLQALLDSSSQFTLSQVSDSLSLASPDFLIDASYEDMTTILLSALCEEIHTPLLVLGTVRRYYTSPWTFYLGETYKQLAEALSSALSCLGFQTVTVVSDSSSYSQELLTAFHSTDTSIHYDISLFPPQQPAETFVGKVLRPTGNRMTLFLTSPAATKALLKAQYGMHIGGKGYANLMPLFSSLYPLDTSDVQPNLVDGGLIVSEETDASAASEADVYRRRYALLEPFLTAHPSKLKELLELQFSNHVRPLVYVIVNFQNASHALVGRISPSLCSLEAPIYYLGGSSSLPNNFTASIPVSGNFGHADPLGFSWASFPSTVGSVMAFEDINKRQDMLPRFTIEVWNFTAGIISFNATQFAATVMPFRDKFGTALIPGLSSTNTIPLLKYLRSEGVATPFVSASNTHDSLSSPSEFPNFIRLCLPDSHVNLVIAQAIKHMGWDSCSLIVEDFPSALVARESLQLLLPQSGIKILNSPEYQVIASHISTMEEARANFTESFQHIINTRGRVVIVITMTVSSFVPAMFYDLGMRGGDLIIIGREWITAQVLLDLNTTEFLWAAEVMRGSLQFSPDFLVGEIGNSFQEKYRQRLGYLPDSFSCQYYDAALAVGYALEWLLETGKDFLNPDAMMKAIKGSRFSGCTGRVYFEDTSNDRQSMRFALDTLVPNGTAQPFMQRIGVYDPTGMVLLSIDPTYVWADGSTLVPSTFRGSSLGCPFEDRLIHNFDKGRQVFIGAGVGMASLTFSFNIFHYFWQRVPLDYLKIKSELEVEDVLVMMDLGVDFVQSMSLIGNFSFVSEKMQLGLDVLIGNIEDVISLADGNFVHLWGIVEGAVVVWVVAIMLIHVLPHGVLGEGLTRTILDLWCYVFSHWAFIPAVYIFLSSFKCTHGIAEAGKKPSYTTSYLQADCYLSCWQGIHTPIVVFSVLSLVTLAASEGLYRVIWQNTHPSLHIKASVLFIQVKICLQVLLVVNARELDSTARTAVFLGVRGLYFSAFLVKESYGYSRMRLWHVVTETAVLWGALLHLCYLFTEAAQIISALLFTGWACLLIAAEVYQTWKVPSLLYRPQGVNTVHLYKFAFKPATAQIVSNLQLEFERTGKRCSLRGGHYSASSAQVSVPEPMNLEVVWNASQYSEAGLANK